MEGKVKIKNAKLKIGAGGVGIMGRMGRMWGFTIYDCRFTIWGEQDE
jgi:hypothetical protein